MKKFILPLLFIAAIFTACEDEDPIIPNEEELITTLTYTLTPANGGTPVILKFTDLDGEGGDDPVYEVSPLAENTVYNGVIKVENEQETPPEDITEEVKEEGAEHQFFFIDNFLSSDVTYADEDVNMNPIGIESVLETGDATTTGTLTIILRHEPKKPNNGTPEDAGGETDIEVTFDITVE